MAELYILLRHNFQIGIYNTCIVQDKTDSNSTAWEMWQKNRVNIWEWGNNQNRWNDLRADIPTQE